MTANKILSRSSTLTSLSQGFNQTNFIWRCSHHNKVKMNTTSKIDLSSHGVTVAWRQSLCFNCPSVCQYFFIFLGPERRTDFLICFCPSVCLSIFIFCNRSRVACARALVLNCFSNMSHYTEEGDEIRPNSMDPCYKGRWGRYHKML